MTLASVALIVTAGWRFARGSMRAIGSTRSERWRTRSCSTFTTSWTASPGTTKAKELLVPTAREYLDNLARSAGSDRDLPRELAEAYERLAGRCRVGRRQRT